MLGRTSVQVPVGGRDARVTKAIPDQVDRRAPVKRVRRMSVPEPVRGDLRGQACLNGGPAHNPPYLLDPQRYPIPGPEDRCVRVE